MISLTAVSYPIKSPPAVREPSGQTNWRGEPIRIPAGHVAGPRDPDLTAPPIIETDRTFTAAERALLASGDGTFTNLAPHHRGQIPTAWGGVIDEIPANVSHPSGNQHTAGTPTNHPNPSVFNNMEGGNNLRQQKIRQFWQAKAERLVEVESGVWVDPGVN